MPIPSSRGLSTAPTAESEPVSRAGRGEAPQVAEVARGVPLRTLIVEDDEPIATTLAELLQDEGHAVEYVLDGGDALRRLSATHFDLVISDVRLPRIDGLQILAHLRGQGAATDVVLMSAYATVDEAVEVMRNEAYHYLQKPFELNELLVVVNEISRRKQVAELLSGARERLPKTSESVIVGESPAMARLKERVELVSPSNGGVLITGETGTGKELVARAIHQRSPRRAQPFIAINCAAFPDTLLESELFGYERGAFTGAVRRRTGLFRAAQGGSLFLDEVADMSPGAQAKLLRVLDSGTLTPLGSNVPVRTDVRIIAATNVDMKRHVEERRFREDLYYRLNVFHIEIPPLRERRSDLPLLIEHFCRRFSEGNARPGISPGAWSALSRYAFPGNVRQLEHAIQHALVLSKGGEIELEHLPAEIRDKLEKTALRPLADAVADFEREYLLEALKQVGWQKQRVADLLDISRKTLWVKLRRYGLS